MVSRAPVQWAMCSWEAMDWQQHSLNLGFTGAKIWQSQNLLILHFHCKAWLSAQVSIQGHVGGSSLNT